MTDERYEYLENKWNNDNISKCEVEELAEYMILTLSEFIQGRVIVDEVMEDKVLEVVKNGTAQEIIMEYEDIFDTWFSILAVSIQDENYEFCTKLSFILKAFLYAALMAIEKFRKDLFTDKFILRIKSIYDINNQFLTSGVNF